MEKSRDTKIQVGEVEKATTTAWAAVKRECGST
jgi:cation transport regulator ChaB